MMDSSPYPQSSILSATPPPAMALVSEALSTGDQTAGDSQSTDTKATIRITDSTGPQQHSTIEPAATTTCFPIAQHQLNHSSTPAVISDYVLSKANAMGTEQELLSTGASMNKNMSSVAANPVLAFLGRIEVKLFVGRLPTTSSEDSIRPLFTQFGDVVEVVVIRDRATGAHKGSAFIRMASITQADKAIRALHNSKVIDPSLGPLQISYATGEAERLGFTPGSITPGEDEAKLFVGSLPRDVTEQDVEQFFSKYGKAFDAYLMRDPATRHFKGCGFIKFAYKEEALVAVKQLHNIVTFPGASRPLEVRIAEPKRSGATATIIKSSQHGARQQYGLQRGTYTHPQQQQQQPSNANPRSSGPWKEYFASDGRPYYHNDQLGLTQWEVPPEFLNLQQVRDPGDSSADVTGPPGANIFVFHVPNEWGKEDLISHFASFGYILSAKVAVDHTTGRNKGYGFVSYDNIRSALQAVQQMNLVAVKNKHLRVSIKSGEEEHARIYAEQHGLLNSSLMSTTPASNSNVAAMSGVNMPGYPQHLSGDVQAALAQQASNRIGATSVLTAAAKPQLFVNQALGQHPSIGITGLGPHTSSATSSGLINGATMRNPLGVFNPVNAFVGHATGATSRYGQY